MTPLRIIGAGGHGKVVADTAMAMGYEDIAFLDQEFPARHNNGAWRIVGKPDAPCDAALFCVLGSNAVRAHFFDDQRLVQAPVLVHPSAVRSPSAKLGVGTLMVAVAIVNADADIGRGAILNTECSVDHDCHLNDFVHISPGARLAGAVHV